MIFRNAYIFQGEKGFVKGGLSVSDGRIQEILLQPDREEGKEFCPQPVSGENQVTDLMGLYVIPGLVDIHTHGNSGCDFSDGDYDGLKKMGRYLALHGITSFLPTSMTLPYEKLAGAFATAERYVRERPEGCARIAGIHMEGPYFSEKKKGAQNSAYLKDPDPVGFMNLQEGCGGLIRIVDVAPELPGAVDFIRRVSPYCRVSVAHTDSSYEEAAIAFDNGASHLTHMFNAMPPVHHRNPGVIPAACERKNVAAELICDGLHVHPGVIRMAFRLFPGRICLISDALRCCGMPDGQYELGGQQVTLKEGQARLSDGTIAGASSNLYEDMVNVIRFGIPAEEAILAATLIPASEAGADAEIGSLEPGKKADFIVCDTEWNLKQVYINGLTVL